MLKLIFLIFCSISMLSCTSTKYINTDINCLINQPPWKSYFEVHALRDLKIRVDSISSSGMIRDTLGNNVVRFELFKLFVKMKNQTSGSPVFNPNRKPSYLIEDVQINVSVSDTLSESVLTNLQKEDSDENIEKGYTKRKNFLYINNYNNNNEVYLLVNLRTKIAYKVEQDKENSKYTSRCLDQFVRYGCRQGIEFIGKDGTFSFGDYIPY